MANPKLFSEFRSSHGNFYLIEIWDDEYTGTDPDQFDVTGDGFQLTYSGQTDDIYSPIIGSSVSFGMYVQDSATNTFLLDVDFLRTLGIAGLRLEICLRLKEGALDCGGRLVLKARAVWPFLS